MDSRTPVPGTLLDIGIAAAPLSGETANGDRHLLAPFAGGLLVGVIDGLGHGPEAAAAAERAAQVLAAAPEDPLPELIRRCHVALTGQRGVVVALAVFRLADSTMTWAGVGNIEGVLVRATNGGTPVRMGLVTRGGIVGSDLPEVRPQQVPLVVNDLIAFATDGVGREFIAALAPGRPVQPLAEELLARFGKGTDDALVLVSRYRGPER